MRVLRGFCGLDEIGQPEQRPQANGDTREGVHAARLAIDDANRARALEPRVPQRVHRLDRSTSCRDDVLEQTDALARRKVALEAVRGAVLLRLLAHDEKREPRRDRGRRSEWDRADLG